MPPPTPSHLQVLDDIALAQLEDDALDRWCNDIAEAEFQPAPWLDDEAKP